MIFGNSGLGLIFALYVKSVKRKAGGADPRVVELIEKDRFVILEAFAKYLHAADPTVPTQAILSRWLWERLTTPPENIADRVLRTEITIEITERQSPRISARRFQMPGLPGYVFATSTDSGRRMLRSLYEYASSYEQQRWSRWVHCVKASDFNQIYNKE